MKKNSKSKKNNNEENNSSSFLLGFFVDYFKPSAYLTSIKEIDLDILKMQGIKLILCDLDNTLVPHFTKFPTKQSIDFVKEAKRKGMKFIVVSNNTKKRVEFFSEKLGISDYVYNAKKPLPFKIGKIIEKMNISPQETVMIGDMLITDTLAANFIHIESILVQPLMDPDKAVNKIIQWFESKVFKKLSKENLIVKSETIKRTIYNEDNEIL